MIVSTQMYLDQFECVPNNNILHVIFLNETSYHLQFCPEYLETNITSFSKNLFHISQRNCGTPCIEYLYQIDVEQRPLLDYGRSSRHNEFKISGNNYMKIIYFENLLFIQLVIKIANLLSLWHGVNFLNLFKLFYFKRVFEIEFVKKIKRISFNIFV